MAMMRITLPHYDFFFVENVLEMRRPCPHPKRCNRGDASHKPYLYDEDGFLQPPRHVPAVALIGQRVDRVELVVGGILQVFGVHALPALLLPLGLLLLQRAHRVPHLVQVVQLMTTSEIQRRAGKFEELLLLLKYSPPSGVFCTVWLVSVVYGASTNN